MNTRRLWTESDYESRIVCGNRHPHGAQAPPPSPPSPPPPRFLLLLPRSKKVATPANTKASDVLKAFAQCRERDFDIETVYVYDDECNSQLLNRLLNDAIGHFLEVTVQVDASKTLPAVLLFEGTSAVGSWASRTVADPPATLVLSAYRVETEEDLRCIDVALRRVALPRVRRRNSSTEWKSPQIPSAPPSLRMRPSSPLSSSENGHKGSPASVLYQVFGPDRVKKAHACNSSRVASGWEERLAKK